MSFMFRNCKSIQSIDVSNFDTSQVTDMSLMFNGCSSLKSLELKFDTKNVENMSSMFRGCTNINSIILTNFETSNVKDFNEMFHECPNLSYLDISNFSHNGYLENFLEKDYLPENGTIITNQVFASKINDSIPSNWEIHFIS